MSKCDLSIRLEEPDRVFRPGETVRGELLAEVNAPCACKALTIGLGWRTHGRGNRANGVKAHRVLFQGEMLPGVGQRHPFEFIAPPGPATYHGKLLNVDWYLAARADIPWAIDPKAEAEVLLEAGGSEEYDFGPEYKPPEELYKTAQKGVGCAAIFLALLAFSGVVVLAVWGWMDAVPFAVGLGLLLVGLLGLTGVLWRGIAQRKLGTPEVRIGSSVARPGDRIPVSIVIKPRAAVRLEGVHAELRGWEEVVSGSGTNKSTHRQVLHEEKATLGVLAREVSPGETVALEGELAVPPGAPPTFAADDNELKWWIVLHVEIAGWPDWKREYPISVRP